MPISDAAPAGGPEGLPAGMLDNCVVGCFRADGLTLDYARDGGTSIDNDGGMKYRLPRGNFSPVRIETHPTFDCNEAVLFAAGPNQAGDNQFLDQGGPFNMNGPGFLLRQTLALNQSKCAGSHFETLALYSPSMTAGDPTLFFPSGCDGSTWRIAAEGAGQRVILAEGGFVNGLPVGPHTFADIPVSMRSGTIRTTYDVTCP